MIIVFNVVCVNRCKMGLIGQKNESVNEKFK